LIPIRPIFGVDRSPELRSVRGAAVASKACRACSCEKFKGVKTTLHATVDPNFDRDITVRDPSLCQCGHFPGEHGPVKNSSFLKKALSTIAGIILLVIIIELFLHLLVREVNGSHQGLSVLLTVIR